MTLRETLIRWLGGNTEPATLPVEPPKDKPAMKVGAQLVAYAAAMLGKKKSIPEGMELFRVPTAAPGVIPKREKMAVDSACAPGGNPAAGLYGYANEFYSIYEEGLAFPGYPSLSFQALRAEYRRPSEILADEMTRNWGQVYFTGEHEDKDETVAERMEVIEQELTRLNVQDTLRKAFEQDGLFGGAHIFINMGQVDNDDVASRELLTPLVRTPQKVKPDSFVGLQVVEPIWIYPSIYNSSNPLASDFYKPQQWYVMGRMVHTSRLINIVSREVPDLLKPAYSFRGLSLTQMGKPYVDNWLETRQSVNDIIQKFSTSVLKTDLNATIQGGGEDFINRINLFTQTRRNSGVLALDKENEEFENVSAPLASLDKLQAQAQEHQAACFGVPLIKLFGITPTGLNATAEPEMQAFYESLSSSQEKNGTPVMKVVIELIQLSKFGNIDENIGWKWHPLKHLDKKEEAEVNYMRAQTSQIYTDIGAVDNAEVREALAHDEDGPYPGLDLNYTPDVPDLDSSGDGNEPARGEESK